MGRRARVSSAIAAAVAVLFASACGQHSGVYQPGAGEGQLAGSLDGGTMVVVDPETGRAVTVPVGAATAASPSGGSVVVQAPPASTAEGDAVPPSERAALTIAQERAPVGGNTDGVSDSTIKIGIHVPLTGTAPVPANALKSFEVYWKYLCDTERFIAGRCVEIVWENDESDPTQARQACKSLVEEKKVFMLMGIAGSHLIQACARYAAALGIPYFAGGSVEQAFESLSTHFSMSMPHTRQAPLVADLMADRLDARSVRNGMVRPNIAILDELERKLDVEMERRGARFHVHSLVNADWVGPGTAAQLDSIVQTMKSNRIRNVYFNAGPFHFVHFVRAAAAQGYHPQMVGSGPAWGLESFIDAACGTDEAAHGALTFNPWPAYEDRGRFDPEFSLASGNSEWDWWMWGLMKTVGKLLAIPGRDLSRERLLWYTARARVASGVFPPVSFSPTDHFGGESMHLLRADCKRVKPAWVTDRAFVRP